MSDEALSQKIAQLEAEHEKIKRDFSKLLEAVKAQGFMVGRTQEGFILITNSSPIVAQ